MILVRSTPFLRVTGSDSRFERRIGVDYGEAFVSIRPIMCTVEDVALALAWEVVAQNE